MSNAINCDFSVQGSGPALFLTHGIGAAKNAWRFMISELSKYFTDQCGITLEKMVCPKITSSR